MDTQVKRVMVVFGTRPEAIKMAPVVLGLVESPQLEPVVVVTAQHRAMLDQVLDLFEIRPHFDLGILRPGQTLTEVTLEALGGLSPLVSSEAPAALLVQGDTTTTLAAALAGFYHQVPVVHLEAGLRTGDRLSPYPEELNRRLTTQLASLHLAPTSVARANLVSENIDPSSIFVTGNTVIDALAWAVGRRLPYGEPALDDLDHHDARVLLVTAHRRESWGAPMEAIGQALAEIAAAEPDLVVVFPIHANPVVRHSILPAVRGLANVRVVEPLAYGGFARLMGRSHIILTDSGGIQEEGPSLGKPVLVMRNRTERPEGVQAGTVRLVGTRRLDIVAAVSHLLRDPGAYAAMANAVNPYGDGRAAHRSVTALAHLLGEGPPPEPFRA